MGLISDLSAVVVNFIEESQENTQTSEILKDIATEACDIMGMLKASRAKTTIKEMFVLVEKRTGVLPLDSKIKVLRWLAAECAETELKDWNLSLENMVDALTAFLKENESEDESLQDLPDDEFLAAMRNTESEKDFSEREESVPEKPNRSTQEKKMKLLAQAMASIMDSEEETSDHENTFTRPRLAKKTVPVIGKDERMIQFYMTFKQQVESWGVKEDSRLFREYFETAIQNNSRAKSEYWNIRARHADWPMHKVSMWMIKRLDKIEEEEVRRNFERLIQGVSEPVSSFIERFSEVLEPYKLFHSFEKNTLLDAFRSKLRPSNQRQLKSYLKMGMKVDSIEDCYELVETFEEAQGLRQKGKINVGLQNSYKDRTNRRKRFSSFKKFKNEKDNNFSKVKDKDRVRTSTRKEKLKCYICKSEEHLIAGCPFNSFRSAESAKEEHVMNIAASGWQEPKPLPIFSTYISGRDSNHEVSVLLDTGSDTSLIRQELTKFAIETHPSPISFSGVGSSGFSAMAGSFNLLL